jgi:branched-chain amino acid transport system permease protein
VIALQLFVSRTHASAGRCAGRPAMDRDAAQLMGVDINRTNRDHVLHRIALAGGRRVVQGLYFGNIQFTLGFQAGLKAFNGGPSWVGMR